MIRLTKIIANISDSKIYDAVSGAQLGANSYPYTSSKELSEIEIQYVTAYTSLTEFTPYLGFVGQSISSSAVIDNDYNHIDKGVLATSLVAGAITSIEITASTLDNIPQTTGTIQLINAGSQTETVAYTSVSLVGLNYVFVVSVTIANSYDAGNQASTNDPPLVKTTTVDSTGKDTGLFSVSLDTNSQPYLLEVEGKSKISNCIFEQQIRDDSGNKIFEFAFPFICKNSLDDDGVLSPPVGFDFYTKIEVNALLDSKMNLQALAVNGNIAIFDNLGQAVDSTFSPADFGADITNQSTSLLTMTGTVTAGITAGTVILPSITGVIVDNVLGLKYNVSYTGGAEVAITAPENFITLFYLDKDSNLLQQNTNVSPTEARRGVYFSGVETLDGVNVNAVADLVATTPYSPALSISDLWDRLGVLCSARDIVSANGANLSINIKEHDIGFTAINFKNVEAPNDKTITAKVAPTITRYWEDGVGGLNADQSAFLNPLKWDDGSGTLADVGLNQFQNVTFFMAPQDEAVSLFFGKKQYGSMAAAIASIDKDKIKTGVERLARTQQYIGTISIRQDAVALTDTNKVAINQEQQIADVYDNMVGLGDGLIQNKVSLTFDEATGIATLTATEEDFIEMQFNGAEYKVSSPQTKQLTFGTDTVPQLNYLYFLPTAGQPVLTLASAIPDFDTIGMYVNVLAASLWSQARTATDGYCSYHQLIDSFNNGKQSHIRHQNDWMRGEGAKIKTGVVVTTTPAIGVPAATLYLNTTSGVVRQLHPHDWLNFASLTDGMYVANDQTTAFTKITGLHEITTDINGTSLEQNNRYANFYIYGMQDEDGSFRKVYVNKPDGFYADETNAIIDLNETAIYTYSALLNQGSLFPICRVTTKWTTGGNFTPVAIKDLREGIFGSSGGGGGGATSFTGLTDTPASIVANQFVKGSADGLSLEFVDTGIGEANTATSIGTGLSVVNGKVAIDLQFNGLISIDANNIIELTADLVNDNIDFNINATNLNSFISLNPKVALIKTDQGAGTYLDGTGAYATLPTGAEPWTTETATVVDIALTNANNDHLIMLDLGTVAERTATLNTSNPVDKDTVVFGVNKAITFRLKIVDATGTKVRVNPGELVRYTYSSTYSDWVIGTV